MHLRRVRVNHSQVENFTSYKGVKLESKNQHSLDRFILHCLPIMGKPTMVGRKFPSAFCTASLALDTQKVEHQLRDILAFIPRIKYGGFQLLDFL